MNFKKFPGAGPVVPVKVRLGSKARDEGGALVDIASIEVHPSWNQKLRSDNDLAVIRLQTAVRFTESIAPIKMVAENDESNVGEMTKISGWGETKKSWESPKFLRGVNVPIVSLETCKSFHYNDEPEITDRMICAGFLEGGLKCHFLQTLLNFANSRKRRLQWR